MCVDVLDLWLCINEWGSSNIGTGVPSGAFARLKPMVIDRYSQYITMRPHILERQFSDNLNDTLTFCLLTSDGEDFNIDEKINIENVNENIIEIKNENIKENIEVNDLIYLYSKYDN